MAAVESQLVVHSQAVTRGSTPKATLFVTTLGFALRCKSLSKVDLRRCVLFEAGLTPQRLDETEKGHRKGGLLLHNKTVRSVSVLRPIQK